MALVNSEKESVALGSVIASGGMALMKLVVGLLTGSIGILSEAAHSLLDLGAAGLTYFAVRVSDKPADADHPYGHAKIESVSALIETGLLFLTSVWIVKEAADRLLAHEVHVEATWYAVAVILISIAIDVARARALMRVARETCASPSTSSARKRACSAPPASSTASNELRSSRAGTSLPASVLG